MNVCGDILIRRAVSRDAEQIIAGINRVCAERKYFSTRCYIPTPQWETVLYFPEKALNHLLYVIEFRGQIIGAVQILPCLEQPTVGVLGIFVLKKYRSQGWGTELLMRVLDAAEKYYDKVMLYVLATNQRAIHCFEKCGFGESSRRLYNYAYLGMQEQLEMQLML